MHPIQGAAGAKIQRLTILIAPGEIVRMLRRDDGPQMLAGRGYLGVQLQELNPSGLIVKSLVEDGPADRARTA